VAWWTTISLVPVRAPPAAWYSSSPVRFLSLVLHFARLPRPRRKTDHGQVRTCSTDPENTDADCSHRLRRIRN
jgi:hypothetical protein